MNQITYSENLKSAIRLLGSRLSTEERRMLIEIVGFAFAEGKILGKEELLIDSEEENEIKFYEQKPKKETTASTTEEDCTEPPF
jgi:hypothetical protein